MIVGSLFSGIGGFDLAFERAGACVAWQVECDAACNRVLERRFPGATRYPDVRFVEHANLAPVDLVCGGFPCQDLSVAGRRAGLAGERSRLWFEFRRVVAELRPRWVVVENVPGLLSSNGGRDMAVVLRGLAELGYGWAYRVLDAQYFGVAQRRRRVFIVGCLGNPRAAAEVLFEPEGSLGDSPPSRAPGGAIADGVGDGPAHCLRARSNSPHRADAMTYVPLTVAFASHPIHARDMAPPVTGRQGASAVAMPTMAVRRLTPVECERLQGFPDGWTEGQLSDGARYRLLGNAVAVPVAEWIARRIMRIVAAASSATHDEEV